MNLDKALFWDVDLAEADYEKYAQFIINRVLLRGNMQDWRKIKLYYGVDRIKNEVKQMTFLDDKTLHYCSVCFNIPLTEFKCYNTPPSIKELWNY